MLGNELERSHELAGRGGSCHWASGDGGERLAAPDQAELLQLAQRVAETCAGEYEAYVGGSFMRCRHGHIMPGRGDTRRRAPTRYRLMRWRCVAICVCTDRAVMGVAGSPSGEPGSVDPW